MKVYRVEICEELRKTVLIKADCEREARWRAESLYNQGDIVLDADDYCDTEINTMYEEEKYNESDVL